jgi:hypothetical protein
VTTGVTVVRADRVGVLSRDPAEADGGWGLLVVDEQADTKNAALAKTKKNLGTTPRIRRRLLMSA